MEGEGERGGRGGEGRGGEREELEGEERRVEGERKEGENGGGIEGGEGGKEGSREVEEREGESTVCCDVPAFSPPLFSLPATVKEDAPKEREEEHPDHETTEEEPTIDYDPHKIGPTGLRCSHISSPNSIFTTPLIGDFNTDGRLDVCYTIAWGGLTGDAFKVLLVTSDLERLFVGAYGKEILDFETFLPPKRQPWTQYMGVRGDGVFGSVHSRT